MTCLAQRGKTVVSMYANCMLLQHWDLKEWMDDVNVNCVTVKTDLEDYFIKVVCAAKSDSKSKS